MENLTLKEVLGYGLQGFQTVIIWMLWNRLNVVTDKLFGLLAQGAAERAVLAQQQGLSTQDLSRAAAEVRQRRANEP